MQLRYEGATISVGGQTRTTQKMWSIVASSCVVGSATKTAPLHPSPGGSGRGVAPEAGGGSPRMTPTAGAPERALPLPAAPFDVPLAPKVGNPMLRSNVIAVIVLLSLGGFCRPAWAELDPLRTLPLLDANFSGCPADPQPQQRSVNLITRESMRHDVGPFSVHLPGYATTPSDVGRDSYVPLRIEACRGDTLRVALKNKLLPAYYQPETNLHTHGLIVRPTPDMPGPPGDYVFLAVAPGAAENYRIEIPADLPGSMFGKTHVPQPYPSGLYWFHAHRHMFARGQVQGGDAGVLSVGNPLRIDYRDDGGKTVSQDLPAGTQVSYLALRDIQLAVPHGLRPAAATGQQAQWINGQDGLPDYDSGACVKAGAWFVHGGCGHDGLPLAAGSDASRDVAWLFTVNGQHFPQLTAPSTRPQLWRIANLSANVTYVLEIAEGADPAKAAPTRPFFALTLDGVVAGTPVENEPTELLGVPLKRLLLMPAARAEIFLPASGCAGTATLRTVGLQTGPGGDPAPTGDPWPPIDLARLRTTGGGGCDAAATSPQARSKLQAAPALMPQRPAGLDIRISRPEAADSRAAPDAAAQAMLHAAPPNAAAPPTLATLHPACRFLPAATGAASYRRRITFDQGDDGHGGTAFKLGSEIVDATGQVVAGSAIGPETFPDPIDWAATAHICPVLGAQEVWELVNITDEMHNFHIHQTKFRLADAKLDTGVPPGLKAVVAVGAGCASQPASAAFCDPLGVVGGAVAEAGGATPSPAVDAWHDTIPVPPRDAAGHPGRVFVSIPFKAPVQEGRFVFHCHILEHEDGGMMAPVEVLSAETVNRQQVSEVISMGPMQHNR